MSEYAQEPFVDEDGEDYYAQPGELDAALGPGWQERWAAEDAAQQAAAAQEQLAAQEQNYVTNRLVELGTAELGPLLEEHKGIDVAKGWAIANKLVEDPDWVADHKHLGVEQRVSAALREGFQSVSPAQDETTAAERFMARRRAGF